MSEKIKIRLITPEELLFTKDVDSAILPGSRGAFAVLPKRAPLIAELAAGVLVLKSGSSTEKLFITSGTAEISDNECNIIVETAIEFDKVKKDVLEEKLKDLRAKAAEQSVSVIKTELDDHIAFIEMILEEIHKD